jgi:thiamine-phosphate pyrophosphorylase
MSLNQFRPILYLITRGATTETTTPESPEFQDILNQISAAVGARIDLIQIREKKLNARTLFELTQRAVQIVEGTTTRVLINDRADIAAGAGASGVHLTTRSLDPAMIRKSFGDRLLIGASTHSLQEARRAHDQGADFIVCGPIFQTLSKEQFGPPVGLQKLSEVALELAGFPVLALGGVSELNAEQCFKAGASGLAGISLFREASHLKSLTVAIRDSAKGVVR